MSGETVQEVVGQSVFSAQERREIVKSFVDSYLRGATKVTVWESPNAVSLDTGKPFTGQDKAEFKIYFTNLINIACGARQPVSTLEVAIDDLFGLIVNLRGGLFIQGEFLQSPEVEKRIASLEEEIKSVHKMLEELQQRLKVQSP